MSERQIAQEANFRLVVTEKGNEDKKRRGVKANRYEFKFPENWSNARKERSIVGIRALYVMPKYKNIFIALRVHVWVRVGSVGQIGSWIERPELVQSIGAGYYASYHNYLDNFTDLLNAAINKIPSKPVVVPKDSPYALPPGQVMNTDSSGNPIDTKFQWADVIPNGGMRVPLWAHYDFVGKYGAVDDEEKVSQFTIESIYNRLDESLRKLVYTDPVSGNQFDQVYELRFEVLEMGEDTKALFHWTAETRTDLRQPLIFQNVYDYEGCALYSNLDSMSEDCFLSNTRKTAIEPIKYYELKNSNQTFWIDTYASRDHRVPVYLNPGDALCIEAQLLTSAKPLL